MKQNINILDLLGKPTSLYEKFHEKTKIKTKMTLVPRKNWPKAWKEVIFKEYPRLDNIILPEPKGEFVILVSGISESEYENPEDILRIAEQLQF